MQRQSVRVATTKQLRQTCLNICLKSNFACIIVIIYGNRIRYNYIIGYKTKFPVNILQRKD